MGAGDLACDVPVMSAVVLIAFALIPIISQGHVVDKFQGTGYGFANVKAFGYAAWQTEANRERVLDKEFCTHL